MTKQEFITELAGKLSAFDDSLKSEILGDIADHFNEGIAQGMSEEEICRKLGQPSAVAEQFIEEYGAPAYDMPDFQIPEITIPAINIPGLNVHIPAINIPPSPPVPPAPGAQRNEAAFNQVDANLYEINLTKTFSGVNNIRVELKNSHLTFRPAGQSGEVTVQMKGRARHNRFTVELYGGELNIIENAIRYPFDFIFNRKTQMETVVLLPSSFGGSINAQVSNGRTSAAGIGGDRLSLRNSARDIHINDCRFNQFDIHSTAGNMDFTGNTAAFIKLHSTAGNMRVENTRGVLDAHCTAGNFIVTNHTDGKINIGCAAGDLKIINCSGEIDARSSAGQVKIECDGQILQDINAHSSAGDIRLNAKEVRNINISASAGNVKVKVDKLAGDTRLKSSAGDIRLEAYETACNIDAKASTGNIEMKLPENINCRIETSCHIGNVKNNLRGSEQSPYTLRVSTSMGNATLDAI